MRKRGHGHRLERHTNCTREFCFICEGSLASCLTCRGAEGSLPTDCPWRPMSSDEQEAVMGGTIDYISGHWITADRIKLIRAGYVTAHS